MQAFKRNGDRAEAGPAVGRERDNKNFWERFAGIYTGFMKKNDISYRKLAEYFGRYLTGEMRVLELACGTGQLTFLLASRVKRWEATDFSERMVCEAGKRNENPDIHFMTMDATRITFEDGAFDAVVIANALHIMPDPDAALKEMRRVLKPGGLLFAPTFVYEEGYSKALIWLMEKAGFHTFHKWKAAEFAEYVCERGFTKCECTIMDGKPLPECALIAAVPPDLFPRETS